MEGKELKKVYRAFKFNIKSLKRTIKRISPNKTIPLEVLLYLVDQYKPKTTNDEHIKVVESFAKYYDELKKEFRNLYQSILKNSKQKEIPIYFVNLKLNAFMLELRNKLLK